MSKGDMACKNQALEPVAIVGSACKFPGGVSSPSELWDLLRQPRDVLGRIPESRFIADKFYHPDHSHNGTMNVRHSYLLTQDPKCFDAHFFGIKPLEASAIDPQQRLLLETSYEALESAGIPMGTLKGSNTGVFIGLMTEDYSNIIGRDLQHVPTYFASGTARSIVSNRISYTFDLRGPSMTIDTACSSSLVALHLAVQSLRKGESKCALVGGSNLLLSPEQYIAGTKIKLFSPTGRSRMWDKDASGYGRGEGVAVLVVKTLSQALHDGDSIECIVRETGVNQDGRTKGITMPSSDAQVALIRDTYARSGLDLSCASHRPQYFEAHGTGTAAGDPIEAEAISRALFGVDEKDNIPSPLYVGSIKTVLGHSESTAGVAGVLKASLALQHGLVPPNLLFNELNPAVRPFYSKLRILQEAQDWPPTAGGPRRASVNSFGFGGTNAHAILEQFIPSMLLQQLPRQPVMPLLTFNFSAASEKSLRNSLAACASFLDNNPTVNLRELSWTLNTRRSTLSTRISVAASTVEDLAAKLRHAAQESDFNRGLSDSRCHILGIFTGQGAQWATMGAQLLQRSVAMKKCFEALQESLNTLPPHHVPDWTLNEELLKSQETSRIKEAVISQTLCTAVQVAIVDLLKAARVKLGAVVGHSSGEIAAAYAAGYFSAESAIRVAYYRGLFADTCTWDGDAGRMLAVSTTPEDAQELCELPSMQGRLTLAAYNSPISVTLSGDAEAIQNAKEILEDEEKVVRVLRVDKAYHSPRMQHCASPYVEALRHCRITVQEPSDGDPAWISSVLVGPAAQLNQAEFGGQYWADNMVNPVRFSHAVEYAAGAYGPFDAVIEIGPHPALKGPTTDTLLAVSGHKIPHLPTLTRGKADTEAFAKSLGLLWELFGESAVDFSSFDAATYGTQGGTSRLLKCLPSYCWDHGRQYWHETRHTKAFRSMGNVPHPLLGSMSPDGTPQEVRFRNYISPLQLPWLVEHRIQGQIVFPAAGYISSVVEAVTLLYPDSQNLLELSEVRIGKAIMFPEDGAQIETLLSLRILKETVEGVEAVFGFYSDTTDKGSPQLVENAAGRVRMIRKQSSGSLPFPTRPIGTFVNVNPGRFYNFASEKGYGYDGAFKGLRNTRRKFNQAIGHIGIPSNQEVNQSLIIHPAVLDSALQAVLLAYSYPGDGRLRSAYLPTKVDLIRIELSAWRNNGCLRCSALPFHAAIDPHHGGEFVGDVDIHSELGDKTILQLQGLHGVPLVPPSPGNDAKLFIESTWGAECLEIASNQCHKQQDDSDRDLALLLERVAYFHLRKLGLAFHRHRRGGLVSHQLSFLNYVEHCLEWVSSDTHPWARSAWDLDTDTDIATMVQSHPFSIDLRLIQTAGESLQQALQGEGSLLEAMANGNLLHTYYREALGMNWYLEEVGQAVGQLSHRFAYMNILEIGAGTGAATAVALRAIGQSLGSYTFTDISGGFFTEARSEFASHESRMVFKTLDIEQPITDQGFKEGFYDLVIASLVLHATRNLETALSNVRRLLRPGGFLVLLEVTDNTPLRLGLIFGGMPGWWLGEEDGRKLSPCVSTYAWEALMARTGFSGTHTIARHGNPDPIPLSVMVSQAADERVKFLLDPCNLTTAPLDLGCLTIIGQHVAARGLATVVGRHYNQVSIVPSLEDLEAGGLPMSATVVCMMDLEDRSAFRDFGAAPLSALQAIFSRSKSVLWATTGAQADDPHKNIFIGLQRTIALELSHVQVQSINFEQVADINAHLIATKLLQLEACSLWDQRGQFADLLFLVEPELTVRDGRVMLRRMRLAGGSNERYNSARRTLTRPVAVDTLSLSYTGQGLCVENAAPVMDWCGGRIQLTHSMLRPVRVAGSTLFISAGRSTTGQPVFVLSTSLRSTLSVPPCWTVPAPGEIGDAVDTLMALHTRLIARHVLSKAVKGRAIIVLNPSRHLGECLVSLAGTCGEELFLFTTDQPTAHPWVYVHPQATRRSVRQAVPRNVAIFVDMSENQHLGGTLRSCLPPGCHQIAYPTLTEGLTLTDFRPEHMRDVSDHLNAALMGCGTERLPKSGSFGVRSISVSDIAERHLPWANTDAVLSWEAGSSIRLATQPASKQVSFSGDKTYWLVGLKGSLGLSLCQWMAERGAKHIAISSRHPTVDGVWLDEMAALGCSVRLFQGDISDKSSTQDIYEKITTSMPPIAGVAQGAMVLHDTIFPELTVERLGKVTQPKIDGSIHLDEIFAHQPLEFFVFFSSVAYLAGNAGQSAYSAANAFMTSLAAHRRRRGLAASVIHLGAVVGAGYITRELTPEKQRALYQAGYSFLSEQDLLEIFAEGVLASPPGSGDAFEVSTGLRLEDMAQSSAVKWASNPMFQHLVPRSDLQAIPETADQSVYSVRARLLAATTSDQRFEALRDGVVGKFRSVLQLDSDTSILALSPDELGVDSLVALDIQSWFRKELDLDFPLLKLLNATSVQDLVSFSQHLLPYDATTDTTTSTEIMRHVQADEATISQPPVSVTSNTATTTPSPVLTPKTDSQDQPPSSANLDLRIIETNSSEVKHHDTVASMAFERTVPLSFAQSRFWFLRSLAEDASAFNITATIQLRGHIDVERFGKAFRDVGRRHEALRTAFYTDSTTKEQMQGILPTMAPILEFSTIDDKSQLDEAVQDVANHVYDLSSGRTLRLRLLSISATAHWLILGYHHISMDGVGFQIFFADLERAYTGMLPMTPRILQYPDYSVRQMQEYRNGEWSQELSYWRKQLRETPQALPPLILSPKNSRPATPTFRTYSANVRLDESLEIKIANCCRRIQAKPFHFYTAVFAVLLFRYCMNPPENFCVGVADANRKEASTLHSLGLFLNLLPLQFRLDSTLTFVKVLQNTRATIQDAYTHSRVPFDVLLRELEVPRSVAHTPLFQAFVNYRQNIRETTTFCGCEAEGELVSSGRNAYDVTLDIVDSSSHESLIIMTANADMYAEGDAEILKRSYVNLLKAFTENPAQRIVWAPLHHDEDVQSSIKLGQGPEMSSQWPTTIVDRVDDMFRRYTDKVALTDGVGQSLTYSQTAAQVHRIAATLADRGVCNDSCVGILEVPGPAWVCSMLAVLRVGAACVPLDSSIGTGRLAQIVEDCKPNVVLVDSETLRESSFAQSAGAEILDISVLLKRDDGFPVMPNHARPHDTALITYTSGSTGVPKGVVLKHFSYRNLFELTPPRWGVIEGNLTVLQQSSYAFDISFLQIFTSLCYGGTLVIPDKARRRDPKALCEIVASRDITFTFATPTEYSAWAKRGLTLLRASSWQCAMTGGEPLTSSLLQAFRTLNKSDLRLINCYGPTETTVGCADCVVDYSKDIDCNAGMSLLPNYSVVVVDDNQKPVPAGVPGQILIGGAGVASGYLNKPEISTEAFVADQWLTGFSRAHGWATRHLSGDYGRMTPDGQLLLHGRVGGSTQVKIRGIRVDLQDIENNIVEFMAPHALQAVVSARKDSATETEFLAAFVVLADGDTVSVGASLMASIPSELPLPQYMRPLVAVSLDQMPKTNSGKVDRAAVDSINLQDAPPIIQAGNSTSLSNTERDLLCMWEEVLPRDVASRRRIHAKLDFFHAGGNSLGLVNLQELIKERLNIAVPVHKLFESITLGQMAALLERENNQPSGTTQPQPIDWGKESDIPLDMVSLPKAKLADDGPRSACRGVVAITGATGFLGQELLRQLVADSEIKRIHCIAVRKCKEQLPDTFSSSKVLMYHGDLRSERCGLGDETAQRVFAEADAALHVGADVSFLKSYHSLKPINVRSTQQLVRLCVPRLIPFHFISSASVAQLSGQETFGPSSVRQTPPSENGDGYTASKWVSEVFLENINHTLGLPVTIHRPSSITGLGATETDLVPNLLRYARQTKAIPDLGSSAGYFDFISVESTAKLIIQAMKKSMTSASGGIQYVHECGEVEIAMDDARAILDIGGHEPFRMMPTLEWIQLAADAGMDPLLVLYLRRVAGGRVLFSRLLREGEELLAGMV